MAMFALVISAGIALVFTVLLTAIVIGARQEHPTKLALQGPTNLAALARQVLGLHVRRAEHVQRAGSAIDAGQPGATIEIDAREAR